MKRYMAGTPNIDVTRYFSMFSSTIPGSNICSMTTVAPFRNASSGVTLRPPMWNSGATTSVISSELASSARNALMLFQMMLPWVSIAPFGRPVVPDVYMISATSVMATG
jgi:hypothetical protein